MADQITFAMDLGPLLQDFRELGEAVQKKLTIGAVAAGARVIATEARRLAPEYDEQVQRGHPPRGTLKRAIYYTRLISECTATYETWVIGVRAGKRFQQVKRGKGTVNLDAFYAAWVEYGHYARTAKGVTRDGKKAGRALGVTTWVPAQPFMRPAFALKREEAFKAMEKYLQERLPAATLGMRVLKAAA